MDIEKTGYAARIQAIKEAARRQKAIVRMRKKGMTFGEIGQVFGFSRQYAQKVWDRAQK